MEMKMGGDFVLALVLPENLECGFLD